MNGFRKVRHRGLEKHAPKRSEDCLTTHFPCRFSYLCWNLTYEALPKWRRPARRPSCQDLVNLLRKQLAAHRGRPGPSAPVVDYPNRVQRAAA
jgi:hypothetical protein